MTKQQQKTRTEQEVEHDETTEPPEPIERPGEPTPETTEESESEPDGQSSLLNGHFEGDPRRHRDSNSGDGKLDPFAVPETLDLTILEMSKEELNEVMKRPWEEASEYINDHDKDVTSKSAMFSGEIPYSRLNMLSDHVTGVVEESRLAVTEEGWFISVTDPANVAMLYIWLPANSWDSYQCERVGTTGLSWSTVEDALSHADTDSQIDVTLEDSVDDEDSDSVDRSDIVIDDGIPFEFSGISTGSCRSPPDLPDLELPNSFVLPGVDVREVVDRMDDITDHMRVGGEAEANAVELFGEGDTASITKVYEEFDDLTVYSGSRKNNVFENEIQESADSLFSLDYLKDYFRSPKRGDQKVGYRFQFGNEFPMKVTRDFGDDGFIRFMLAPRIQSD